MLVELVVENYAVVERVRVRFHPGFNLLTGETGSGKSIVVDALGLIFGGRASSEAVRSGAESARISAVFEDSRGEELILEREVFANGKSRAYRNGRPITVAELRELAPSLGDIHGQHDQQRLFDPAAQREILDAFGEVDLTETAGAYREWRAIGEELAQIGKEEQERLRLADLWAFQKREIAGAALKPGEDALLEQEKRRLANVTKLQAAAAEAFAALDEGDDPVRAKLRVALKRLEELAKLDATLAPTLESLRAAEPLVIESARDLTDYLDRLEADPRRLDEVESRLAALDKLKRKYGATLDEVIAYGESVAESLAKAESAGDRAKALEEGHAKAALDYTRAAGEVTAKRREAARSLEKRLAVELKAVALGGTRLSISIEPHDWSASGADRVEFLISPNAGEEPRAIEKVVSGGELSRLALALQCLANASARTAPGRTLVFDEVDAGIGGAVAEAVGRRLKDASARDQVLCVTHLAQVAAFGDHHYAVEKREANGRTYATVEELTHQRRVRELGRMLAGERVTPEALKHAEKMLAVP